MLNYSSKGKRKSLTPGNIQFDKCSILLSLDGHEDEAVDVTIISVSRAKRVGKSIVVANSKH